MHSAYTRLRHIAALRGGSYHVFKPVWPYLSDLLEFDNQLEAKQSRVFFEYQNRLEPQNTGTSPSELLPFGFPFNQHIQAQKRVHPQN